MDELARDLLAALRPGRDGARSRGELSMLVGVRDRKLRELIEDLRREGHLIGSTNEWPGGYFICVTPEELATTAQHLTSRAKACLATVSAMRRGAALAFGEEQARLFDLEEVPA